MGVYLNSFGANLHAKELEAKIELAAQRALMFAAEAVKANVLTRTPSVDEEYNTLMAGQDGTPEVGRSGGDSADTDAGGRRRLIKDESTYLEHVVASEANSQVILLPNGGVFNIGNLDLLNKSTFFGYINATEGTATKPGIVYPEVTKGPYFENFENGSLNVTVTPQFSTGKGYYLLRPGPDTYVAEMFKPVRAHYMFLSDYLTPIFEEKMIESLKQAAS